MLTKEESSAIKKAFFHQLNDKLSKAAKGRKKAKWFPYQTGIKNFFFRVEVDANSVKICFDFQHKDAGVRELFYEQLEEFKKMLETGIDHPLIWCRSYTNETGQDIARVYAEEKGLNIFEKKDQPKIEAFIIKITIGFDLFWADAKDIFIEFQK